ncbi:MAG TPA: hypothetical protein VGE93_21305 [Bryobacteraceae bacterium]
MRNTGSMPVNCGFGKDNNKHPRFRKSSQLLIQRDAARRQELSNSAGEARQLTESAIASVLQEGESAEGTLEVHIVTSCDARSGGTA